MSTRKIIAIAVLVLTILFPFRLAYLNQPDMGPKSLLNFLLVLVGCTVFGILNSRSEIEKTKMTGESKDGHHHKEAA